MKFFLSTNIFTWLLLTQTLVKSSGPRRGWQVNENPEGIGWNKNHSCKYDLSMLSLLHICKSVDWFPASFDSEIDFSSVRYFVLWLFNFKLNYDMLGNFLNKIFVCLRICHWFSNTFTFRWHCHHHASQASLWRIQIYYCKFTLL